MEITELKFERGGERPARMAPSLRSNFAWTLTANVVYGGCQWAMLSALAKLGSAAIIGQFTLGLAISAPVFLFTSLQLRSVQATDARSEARFADYFSLRLLATGAGLLAIAAMLPFVASSWQVRAVILLVSLAKSIECMSDVTAGLLQREERLDRVAASLMMRGIAASSLFALAFARFHSLVLAVAGLCLGWLAVFLFYDLPNTRALLERGDGFFRCDRQGLRRVLFLSLPLGWVATIASLTVNIPRYVLQHERGFAEQGIFASLAYLVVAINLVVVALTQSVTTRLAFMYATGEHKRFKSVILRLSALGAAITGVGVPLSFLVGRPLLTLVYRPEYGEHVGLLALLVATAGVSTTGTFLFCAASAARAFRVQVPVYLLAMMTAGAGAILLVPRLGMIGAALALLLAAMVVVAGGLVIMRKLLHAI